MKLVILESPFAGDVEENIKYARMCVKDSLSRGEAPIASHLLYTQDGILNDDIQEERQLGINAGLAWREVAHCSVVYADRGISKGMEYGIARAKERGIPVEIRYIENNNINKETAMTNDAVKSPKHYQILDGFESIEIIASAMTHEQWKGYCLGNIIKYRMRAGNKDALEQDIGKANFYKELYDIHKHLCRQD